MGVSIKKLIIAAVIIALVFISLFLYRNWGMLGQKPTELVVNANPNPRAPKLVNDRITNKNDVQKMYRILIRSPKLPNGPISCPNDNGISYRLTFISKNKTVNIGVEPTGCEIINIGKNTHKTFAGNKRAEEFWSLLAKDLNIDLKTLRKGTELVYEDGPQYNTATVVPPEVNSDHIIHILYGILAFLGLVAISAIVYQGISLLKEHFKEKRN